MTNALALVLGILILGVFALDHFVFEWGLPVFVMRKLAQLSEYIAFWR